MEYQHYGNTYAESLFLSLVIEESHRHQRTNTATNRRKQQQHNLWDAPATTLCLMFVEGKESEGQQIEKKQSVESEEEQEGEV